MANISRIRRLLASSALLSMLLMAAFQVDQAQCQKLTLATMSMSLDMLRETKDVWANMVLNIMSKIPVRDLIFEEGMVGDNKLFITGLQGDEMQDVDFEIDEHTRSFKLGVKDINMAFQANRFRYRTGYIALKGAVDVRCQYVSFNVTIKATKQVLEDGRAILAFKVTDFEFLMPRKHVSLAVHGNLEVGTAAIFKRLFVGKLREQLQEGMVHALQDELMPKINGMMAQSKGYMQFVPGMEFDTALQEEPTMKEGYFGLEMDGMFRPAGGPDLQPGDVELNSTAVDSPLPVHDQAKEDKKKFEVFLHQISLTSIAVSFLRGNAIQTKITNGNAYDSPVPLTTTGLNDIVIQKQPKRKKKQPEGCGFVANYGEEQPVELHYTIEGIRNFRIKKNNGTMMLNCDMKIEFFVQTRNGTKLALELHQQNVVFYFTADMASEGHVTLTITGKTVGRLTVAQSGLGQPKPAPPDPNNTEPVEPKRNFGLNMHKLHTFLTQFKPTLIASFNEILAANSENFYFPQKMFGGLFDMNLGTAGFKFHETYLEMEMDPTFIRPEYDETTEPRFIYERFHPMSPPNIDDQEFTFKETISAEDKVVSTRVRDNNMVEVFRNQIQIFGEVPLILSK